MKKFRFLVVMVLLVILLTPLQKVNATPLPGLKIEFCNWGIGGIMPLSRAFNACITYEVEPSYARSEIYCQVNIENDGWDCSDSMDGEFNLPWKSVIFRNLGVKEVTITKQYLERGYFTSYDYSLLPSKKDSMDIKQPSGWEREAKYFSIRN